MSIALNPGIRFNDSIFSEPVALTGWAPPRCPGLFAILAHDPNWAPKTFQPLYFGEFGNNVPLRALQIDYPRLLAAAVGRTLLVAVLPMPFSTTAERRELGNQLVWAYNPECQSNGTALPQGELATNLAFQPPPETPRRRIGFMPQTESAAG